MIKFQIVDKRSWTHNMLTKTYYVNNVIPRETKMYINKFTKPSHVREQHFVTGSTK